MNNVARSLPDMVASGSKKPTGDVTTSTSMNLGYSNQYISMYCWLFLHFSAEWRPACTELNSLWQTLWLYYRTMTQPIFDNGLWKSTWFPLHIKNVRNQSKNSCSECEWAERSAYWSVWCMNQRSAHKHFMKSNINLPTHCRSGSCGSHTEVKGGRRRKLYALTSLHVNEVNWFYVKPSWCACDATLLNKFLLVLPQRTPCSVQTTSFRG